MSDGTVLVCSFYQVIVIFWNKLWWTLSVNYIFLSLRRAQRLLLRYRQFPRQLMSSKANSSTSRHKSAVVVRIRVERHIFTNRRAAAMTEQDVHKTMLQRAGWALTRPFSYIHFFKIKKKRNSFRRYWVQCLGYFSYTPDLRTSCVPENGRGGGSRKLISQGRYRYSQFHDY
jgi:hypothetical protein